MKYAFTVFALREGENRGGDMAPLGRGMASCECLVPWVRIKQIVFHCIVISLLSSMQLL